MRKLSEIVDDYCVAKDIHDRDRRWYSYYRIAVNGLRIVTRETANANWYRKHVKIDKNDAGVFPMPNDYTDYMFVGACVGGRMVAFTFQPGLCPPMTDSCGDMVEAQDDFWYSSTHQGTDSHGIFTGSTHGFAGSFKPFFSEGYFVIQSGYLGDVDQIVLVYKSDMFEKDGDYMVFPNDEEAIKAYITHEKMQHDDKAAVSQKQWAFQQYVNRKSHARKLNNPLKLQDILDAVNR